LRERTQMYIVHKPSPELRRHLRMRRRVSLKMKRDHKRAVSWYKLNTVKAKIEEKQWRTRRKELEAKKAKRAKKKEKKGFFIGLFNMLNIFKTNN